MVCILPKENWMIEKIELYDKVFTILFKIKQDVKI